ncbi:unnamed protein product [Agarophyton chilense]
MDDIKESVRLWAQGMGRALSKLSTHLCNSEYVGKENYARAFDVDLSVFMTSFSHSADEVRALVSETLSEIISHGGTALRSSVPDLIASLLEAATELELQILNYAEYHAASPEELQNARVTAASMSSFYLIDSLERIIGQIDKAIAAEVVSNLARLALIGVGYRRARRWQDFCLAFCNPGRVDEVEIYCQQIAKKATSEHLRDGASASSLEACSLVAENSS